MSWSPALDPVCMAAGRLDDVEMLIIPRACDLGEFEVRRALPAPKRQVVGPFIFFDQIGPAEFLTGQGIDARPHPHIALGDGQAGWVRRGLAEECEMKGLGGGLDG